MRAGILGLPSSGKSIVWCLLTESLEGPDPSHIGKLHLKTVKIHDPRLERIRDDFKPKKCTPASIEIGDFPPLSHGEHDRTGIAELLSPARAMNVLIVVLRAFENAMVPPPGGELDPLANWEEIDSELLLSDLVIVEKRIEKLRVRVKKPTPTQEQDRQELALLERIQQHLEAESNLATFPFTEPERKLVQGYQFLSGKPKIIIVNRGESPSDPQLLKKLAEKSGAEIFEVAAQNELEILQLPEEDQETFREELGVVPGTREKILAACYRAAGLISFFTAGEKEVRAWTIRKGELAVEAAEEIHTDMARGFIRAETISYTDYERYNGVKGAKESGHFRLEGKEYIVQDGDIIEFRFNI